MLVLLPPEGVGGPVVSSTQAELWTHPPLRPAHADRTCKYKGPAVY